MHGTATDVLLRQEALFARPEMAVGGARLHPATRLIEGPDGSVTLEPRILQLLVALADAAGEPLSRHMIEARCWGVAVSEDAINQAVASLRRAARAVGGFHIETIPRTGYRLVADPSSATQRVGEGPFSPTSSPLFSRRALVIGTGALAATIGGGAFAWLGRQRDPRVVELVQQGEELMRLSWAPRTREAAERFAEATRLAPGDAAAWGRRAEAACELTASAPSERSAAVRRECDAALSRALELDPDEPNAIAAQALLETADDTLLSYEDRLLAAHARAPANIGLIESLEAIAQATGQTRLSWQWNEKGMAADPDVAGIWWKRALKHWIMGDWRRADLVIERAMQRWPEHPFVWGNRLQILAYTGRAEAGLRLLETPAFRAIDRPPVFFEMWRSALRALSTRAAADIAAARAALVSGNRSMPGFGEAAAMMMSGLGDVDSAYSFAEGEFLHRGSLAGGSSSAEIAPGEGNAGTWRMTQFLFTPPAAAMRADPRFAAFARDMGLIDYWRARGVMPDALHGLSAARLGL